MFIGVYAYESGCLKVCVRKERAESQASDRALAQNIPRRSRRWAHPRAASHGRMPRRGLSCGGRSRLHAETAHRLTRCRRTSPSAAQTGLWPSSPSPCPAGLGGRGRRVGEDGASACSTIEMNSRIRIDSPEKTGGGHLSALSLLPYTGSTDVRARPTSLGNPPHAEKQLGAEMIGLSFKRTMRAHTSFSFPL